MKPPPFEYARPGSLDEVLGMIAEHGDDAKVLAGGVNLKATQYRVKVEIGGIIGFLAPLVGKQPQDSHAWIVEGDAPAFVRLEGPFFAGGPSWRIEPANPVWQER